MEIGTRIGAYQVIAKLGEGGMGEVFRARDTRLRRDVAIKVLPDSVAADGERLARFEREAQVLATLNHPNIAHGLEPFASSAALVMELVEGRDLAERLAQGPIPIGEAIAIATQMAHAIEAAHEQGIIHRDLKPGNIKLRDDGTVKILDFGLAKALDPLPAEKRASSDAPNSPTITSPAAMTMQGVVLGTAAYMSPEQARGKTVDRRADIWAFGVVLYEMLTGRSVFAADTVTDSIAAVLTREPAFEALPAQTPPAVRRVLQRCLQKDAARRFHHMADARIEMEQASAEPPSASEALRPPSRSRWGALAFAALALIAGIVGTVGWFSVIRAPEPPQRYSLVIPDAGFNTVSHAAISPDGKLIAYSPNAAAGPFRLFLSGTLDLMTRPGPNESHLDAHILPGSKTVLFTIATPTSASIAAMPLSGGAPRVILEDAARPVYARGHLLFRRPSSSDLMSVTFDPDQLAISGERVRLAAVAHVVDSPAFDVSREGTIIFSGPNDATEQAGYTAVMVNQSGGDPTVLAPRGSWAEPRISPDGRTLVLRDIVSPNCILWSLDLQRGTKTRVTFEGDNHNAIWRSDGQLSWGSAVEGPRGIRVGPVDRPSPPTALAAADNERVPESWSPDRTRLALTETHPTTQQDIWLLAADTGVARPLANSRYKEHQARFSPDGRWLAYVSDESGRDEVYLQLVEGDGRRVQVSVDGGHSPLWAPGGTEIFFVERTALMAVKVNLQPATPEIGRPARQLEGRFVWERVGNFDITPDGQRFVFVQRSEQSDPSATLRVLVNWLVPR